MSESEEPFMEHPTGEFSNAVSAMESAIERLRSLDRWDQWIAFCGQGQGSGPDTVHFAEVRLRREEIKLEVGDVELMKVFSIGGLKDKEIAVQLNSSGSLLVVKEATAVQLARLLDGIFRGHLGIRNFEDEKDYSVGAEWCDDED